MAKKSVTVSVTNQQLGREENGVVFVVMDGDTKFGELLVSTGGVRWKPKGKQKRHFIDWSNLDSVAKEYQES